MTSFLEKIQRLRALLRLAQSVSEKKRDRVRYLQKLYKFDKDRMIVVEVFELNVRIPFQIKGGELIIYDLDDAFPKPDIYIRVDRLCTLKHVRLGYIGRRHPTYGTMRKLPFNPQIAWENKFIQVTCEEESITNELLLAASVLGEIIDYVPAEEVAAAFGPCEHDVL